MKLPNRTTGTSTDYTHPYRPLVLKAVNRIGEIASAAGLKRPITPGSLKKAAEKATGLSDYGGVRFEEGLTVLAGSIEEEARLNLTGRFITRKRLETILMNRLRAEKFRRLIPRAFAEPLKPVVVITGLQRTGTTFLHRLLSSDKRARALLSWEAINPVPNRVEEWVDGPPASTGVEDRRVRVIKMSEKILNRMSPDYFNVHPTIAEAPEEDVLLLDFSFLSTVPEAILRVPSYSGWVEQQDQTPAYRYMKDLLKILQWQRQGEYWVLKTPHHLEFLDTLFEVFPDVRVIQTHRDPCVSLASFCSMIAHGRGVFSDSVYPEEIGRDWSRKIVRMVQRSMISRDHLPADRFLDVSFYDLIADPLGEIEKVYDFLGLPFISQTRIEAADAVRKNSCNSGPGHTYRLEDFGLSETELRERFAGYIRRYGIPVEKEMKQREKTKQA